jgi:hypothetical protein
MKLFENIRYGQRLRIRGVIYEVTEIVAAGLCHGGMRHFHIGSKFDQWLAESSIHNVEWLPTNGLDRVLDEI